MSSYLQPWEYLHFIAHMPQVSSDSKASILNTAPIYNSDSLFWSELLGTAEGWFLPALRPKTFSSVPKEFTTEGRGSASLFTVDNSYWTGTVIFGLLGKIHPEDLWGTWRVFWITVLAVTSKIWRSSAIASGPESLSHIKIQISRLIQNSCFSMQKIGCKHWAM